MPTSSRPREAVAQIRRVAQERFGFDALRAGQLEPIRAVLAGQDTLAVLPTGAGKSAIYQIAASLLPGPTVVVSPLIALQRDQVESLETHDAGAAAEVNASLSATARRETFEELQEGELAFLFLAPEQFANPETFEQIRAAKPSLFVVDEAHCISEWGHDFRPDYLRLGGVIAALGHPTILALTATASPPVREEIVERLGMVEPRVIVSGFDRPNIWLGVETFADEDEKRDALLDRVVEAAKPGIVYAATRKHAEGIAHALQARGVKAAAYHAGMKSHHREEIQTAFMEGALEVIVATTAFGMGIDKADVRFVFHVDVSDSVDSYYQEIGRAGRDGQPATAILFYDPQDLGLQRFLAAGAGVDADEVAQVMEILEGRRKPIAPTQLAKKLELSDTRLLRILNRLEDIGAVAIGADGAVTATRKAPAPEEAAAEAAEENDRHRAFARTRVDMIRSYAEVRDCRRKYLLTYFGEDFEPPCGNCDNCDAGVYVRANPRDEPFPVDSRVVHKVWGEGLVIRYEGDKIVVLFDEAGYRTLALPVVEEEDLLRPAEDSSPDEEGG